MAFDDQDGFLSGLPARVNGWIRRAADAVALEYGAVLVGSGKPTADVYFVEAGFLSITAGRGDGSGIEIGLIGREGMVGSWLLLGTSTTPFDVVVRSAGRALRLPAAEFTRACVEHAELRASALAHCQHFTDMVVETCQAHARLTVEGRLARWLLLAHDRLDGDELPITHDAISRMLGVRRPGVTVALHVLEGEHMVKATRGQIRVLDREKLKRVAGGHYRAVA